MPSTALTRWSLVVIAACVGFAALRMGQGVFAPILLALVIGVVLAPLSDFCLRLGAPRAAATLVSMLVGLGVMTALALILEPLVWQAVEQAPAIWLRLRETFAQVQAALAGLGALAGAGAEAVGGGVADADGDGAPEAGFGAALPSLADALFLAPAVAAQALIFFGALFFFLLSRVEVYDFLSRRRVLSRRPRDVSRILLAAERRVSRYFTAILLINAAFGTLIGLAMWGLGMPTPMTWGLLAFLLNFILYLGPILMAGILLVAGSMTFSGIEGLLPAAVYVGLNAMEGQFVTPSLVGRHLRVSPLLVFVSLVFWLWLWGPLGGFIAIPLLVWVIAVSTGAREERSSAIEATIDQHEHELQHEAAEAEARDPSPASPLPPREVAAALGQPAE